MWTIKDEYINYRNPTRGMGMAEWLLRRPFPTAKCWIGGGGRLRKATSIDSATAATKSTVSFTNSMQISSFIVTILDKEQQFFLFNILFGFCFSLFSTSSRYSARLCQVLHEKPKVYIPVLIYTNIQIIILF